MAQSRLKDTTKKSNPRSSGEINDQIYRKYSKEISLEPEAKELARCADNSLNTSHIFTAKLVSFDKKNNLLATKRILGNELFLTLWNPTSLLGKLRGKKLQDIELINARIAELGSWLSLYHDSSNYLDKNEQASLWLERSFVSKLNGVKKNKLMSSVKINKLERQLLGQVEALYTPDFTKKNNCKICKIHGDFIIYNLLIDKNNNIHVLDFGDTRIACNLDDVARFYSNIWAIAHTNHWRKGMFLDIANNFLTSYGLEPKVVETPYFKLMMAYNFIIHLYGQHCMRDLLSFVSHMELNQITRSGLRWIDTNFID